MVERFFSHIFLQHIVRYFQLLKHRRYMFNLPCYECPAYRYANRAGTVVLVPYGGMVTTHGARQVRSRRGLQRYTNSRLIGVVLTILTFAHINFSVWW